MLTTIQNTTIRATVSDRGAELQSVESAEGVSYLWNGDPAHWSGRAPILFPCVGALRGDRADSEAGEIRLPKHGFARKRDWSLEKQAEDSVTYLLESDDETRAGYPYDFALRARYTLGDHSVTTTFLIKNTGERVMPFCIGGHPAFHVPLAGGEEFEDYSLEFEQPETADCPLIDMQHCLLIDTARNRVLTESRILPLNHVMFRGDALVFDRLKSRRVRLFSRKSGRGVRMDFEGMDFFAVWSPIEDGPLLALEPWTGTGTQVSEDDIFEHKQGMRILQPGQEDTVSFTVTVF